MMYYILQNKEVPWGDYGEILFYGLLTVMDDDYNDIDVHQIERVGTNIPKIYCANSTNLVIRRDIVDVINKNHITGIEKYHNTEFKKIVSLDWQSWNMKAEDPKVYPESGEPIDYIEEGENDKRLIVEIKEEYFSADLKKQPKLSFDIDDRSKKIINYDTKFDIFQAGKGYIVVSEKFKNLMVLENIDTLKFVEIHQSIS